MGGPRILFVHVFFAVRPSDLCDHRGGISMYMSCTTLAQQSLGGDMQHTRSMREEKTFVGPPGLVSCGQLDFAAVGHKDRVAWLVLAIGPDLLHPHDHVHALDHL